MVGLLNPHLDDDDYADVWSARLTLGVAESDGPSETHLRTCETCRAQYAAFVSWLDGIRAEARSAADEVFTQDRLVTQQSQISRRLEALEHPARVIAFPRFARPLSVQPTVSRRWIAAAAAVGLITGVGLGQFLEFRGFGGGSETFVERQVARGPSAPLDRPRALQPVSQAGDEVFLDESEITASQARVPESLQYLNAITPSARDYDPR
jgi:hypothetical protein